MGPQLRSETPFGIGTIGVGYGWFEEYAEGNLVKAASSYASTTKYRRLIAKWGWAETGSHTLKLVNSVTSGHPKLDIDGIVIFQ